MVSSRIEPSINYIESREIDKEDVNMDSDLYSIALFDDDKDVVIALGKLKYTYSGKYGVVYYPMYLISNEHKVKAQIGVFELLDKDVLHKQSDDGSVDIAQLSEPLLYSFVTPKFISKANSDPKLFEHLISLSKEDAEAEAEADDNAREEEEEESDKDEDDVLKLNVSSKKLSKEKTSIDEHLENGIFKIRPISAENDALQNAFIEEETQKIADQYKSEYKNAKSSDDLWIQKFLQNSHYDIHKVEGNGDCFFATVRDAYEQIGKITTVAILRAIVANETRESDFIDKRDFYKMFEEEIEKSMLKSKEITDQMNAIKKRTKKVLDIVDSGERDAKFKEMQTELQRLTDLLADVKKTRKTTTENMREFVYMKNIHSLAEYRQYIMTSQFWADDGTILILEKALNMKMVIFSEQSFKGKVKDLDSVLQCALSRETTEKNIQPNFYIMTSYSGNHYDLITYKHKRIFTFRDIPYDVKILIISKCLEGAGDFQKIQDFRDMKSRLHISDQPPLPPPIGLNDLYDDSTAFLYYESAKDQKPGKLQGEHIAKEQIMAGTPNWRQKLDDSWFIGKDSAEPSFGQGLFHLGGKRYATVEHYVLGAGFKKGFPDFAGQFALDSESIISKNIEIARKAVHSKTGKMTMNGKEMVLRSKNVKPDSTYTEEEQEKERVKAIRAKFEQNQDLKQLLLNTKMALLKHFIRRDEPTTDTELMKLRKEMMT